MKELPDDLAAMEHAELNEQSALRDERLAALFRRWPSLSRLELRHLRELYVDRMRIARYVGSLRLRRRSWRGEAEKRQTG